MTPSTESSVGTTVAWGPQVRTAKMTAVANGAAVNFLHCDLTVGKSKDYRLKGFATADVLYHTAEGNKAYTFDSVRIVKLAHRGYGSDWWSINGVVPTPQYSKPLPVDKSLWHASGCIRAVYSGDVILCATVKTPNGTSVVITNDAEVSRLYESCIKQTRTLPSYGATKHQSFLHGNWQALLEGARVKGGRTVESKGVQFADELTRYFALGSGPPFDEGWRPENSHLRAIWSVYSSRVMSSVADILYYPIIAHGTTWGVDDNPYRAAKLGSVDWHTVTESAVIRYDRARVDAQAAFNMTNIDRRRSRVCVRYYDNGRGVNVEGRNIVYLFTDPGIESSALGLAILGGTVSSKSGFWGPLSPMEIRHNLESNSRCIFLGTSAAVPCSTCRDKAAPIRRQRGILLKDFYNSEISIDPLVRLVDADTSAIATQRSTACNINSNGVVERPFSPEPFCPFPAGTSVRVGMASDGVVHECPKAVNKCPRVQGLELGRAWQFYLFVAVAVTIIALHRTRKWRVARFFHRD